MVAAGLEKLEYAATPAMRYLREQRQVTQAAVALSDFLLGMRFVAASIKTPDQG